MLLWLVRDAPVDELEEANSPLPWPGFEAVSVAAAFGVVLEVPVVAVVDEEDEDDGGIDEEEAVALAPGPVAPVLLGDAVPRLLLYVDLLGLRTELVHALSRLVRDVI